MTIGERVKQKRIENHLSQGDLGRSIGVGKQTIFKYETNITTNIPLDKIEKLALALETTPSYLMGWQTTPTDKTVLADLTPEERDVINRFRSASPEIQQAIRRIVDKE